MKKRVYKTYAIEFKNQVVKEVLDTGKLSAVAKHHNIPSQTLSLWVNKKHPKSKDQTILQVQKKLADAELEISILKDILKKTNQAWLKD